MLPAITAAEPGKIYSATDRDALSCVPMQVQMEMFRGGRLRAARYDGNGHWHVLEDVELQAYHDERLKKEAPVISDALVEAVRLDLACGKSLRAGFEGVDLYAENAKHRIDLQKFPFPFADNSVDELFSSHFLEHLPAREVEERDLYAEARERVSMRERFLGKDFLYAFMDECYRILKPAGTIYIVVPNVRADGGFQDPTHRRFFNQNTFRYFNRALREQMGADHYSHALHDFIICQITPVGPSEIGLKHPEVQAELFMKYWNTVYEWHVTLQKKPE